MKVANAGIALERNILKAAHSEADMPQLDIGAGFYYLATPYTKYGDGLDAAFREASRVAGEMMKRGYSIFCPITHCHPVAVAARLDPTDADFWEAQISPFLRLAAGVFVVEMPGWRESRGVTYEIGLCERTGKPLRYLTWPALEERAHAGH